MNMRMVNVGDAVADMCGVVAEELAEAMHRTFGLTADAVVIVKTPGSESVTMVSVLANPRTELKVILEQAYMRALEEPPDAQAVRSG